MSGLLTQLVWLEQQQQTFRGEVCGQVVCRTHLRRERGDLDRRLLPQTSLAGHGELPDRLDLRAKGFDADRVEQIGGKKYRGAPRGAKIRPAIQPRKCDAGRPR